MRSRRTLSHGHDLEPLPSLRSVQGLKARADPSGVGALHANQLLLSFENTIINNNFEISLKPSQQSNEGASQAVGEVMRYRQRSPVFGSLREPSASAGVRSMAQQF